MQQSDMSSSYYQYYQSHFQNPNPNPTDPQFNPLPTTYASASAPPVSSSYSSSDYSNLPSTHPTEPLPNSPPVYPVNPSLQPTDNTSHQSYSLPTSHNTPYYQYDQNQSGSNYDQLNPNFGANPNSSLAYDQNQVNLNYDYLHPRFGANPNSSLTSTLHGSSSVLNYDSLYGGSTNPGAYGGQGVYGEFRDDGIGEGVYRYSGGKVEPYGARGSERTQSGSGLAFDDYGRPINHSLAAKDKHGSGTLGKIFKAAPKAEREEDVKSGVQKFRVKLLSEGGERDMDILCQVGLDGIQILDPETTRTLKIYPLETVTRWEVLDSHIFAFWTKSSIDIEPRRVRLKSNSYSTNNILDTVAAATFQLKEMGGSSNPSDPPEVSEQPFDKKKGFGDWVNLIKPGNEEKDHWVPDEAVTKCKPCGADFGAFVRRHHCRNCGEIFCDKCTQGRITLTADENAQPVRVCDQCMAEVTQRLFNVKEAAVKVSGLQRHEDLARKLQEEMEKNRKASPGLKSSGSDHKRMREVECPTCTIHLQVQVPEFGSETIECSVCQHPFLVSAH
ncbi:hypothetical protein LguiA_005694 [Lonicera macranthoides]